MQPERQPPRLILHSSTSGRGRRETQTNNKGVGGWGGVGAREWAVSEDLWLEFQAL